jgi:hypothetical protein
MENYFLKTTFQTFLHLFITRKVGQHKIFCSQRKIYIGFRKVFSFYFGRKTLFRSYEKFRNPMLFADYIKFSPQTFDCYFFSSISSLRI